MGCWVGVGGLFVGYSGNMLFCLGFGIHGVAIWYVFVVSG